MNYTQAFGYLQQKAEIQGRFKGNFRDRENLHKNYAIHVHGTHIWVPKKEWDKLNRTSSNRSDALDPSKYLHTSPTATDIHTYAIPVPGTPVMLKVYNTDVATFTHDGNVVLRSNGYNGYVTSKWLEQVQHVQIRSIRMDKWTATKWGLRDTAGTLTMFYDGLTLDRDGKIITAVQPFVKHVVDRSKSKAWHDAVKHFRNLVMPFVAMLDGGEPPAPVLEAMKACTTFYDDRIFAQHIMAQPQELDPVLTVALCVLSWRGYNLASWANGRGDHIIHNAMYHFDSRLAKVYRNWAKEHALKEV